MLHELRLHNNPFNLIKQKSKTVEMRLYDEKRQKIKKGDEIIFTNRQTSETIKTKVKDIKLFKNFEELYSKYNKIELGYSENEEANFKDMELYYSIKEQAIYGVCAIEIEVI